MWHGFGFKPCLDIILTIAVRAARCWLRHDYPSLLRDAESFTFGTQWLPSSATCCLPETEEGKARSKPGSPASRVGAKNSSCGPCSRSVVRRCCLQSWRLLL